MCVFMGEYIEENLNFILGGCYFFFEIWVIEVIDWGEGVMVGRG